MKCVCGHHYAMHSIRMVGPTTCISCGCDAFEKAREDGFEDVQWVNAS